MQIMNWIEVSPAGSGTEKLPAGAYVIRIVDVSDHKARNGGNYLTFVYDIAEGPHANHYATETRDYTHSFNRSYTGNAASFFRSFLDALEASNPGKFSIEAWQTTGDEGALRGLTVGALFRDRYYTNTSGKDVGPVLDFVRAMPAKDVRDGNWTVPPVKDDRDGSSAQAEQTSAGAGDYYSSDVPF